MRLLTFLALFGLLGASRAWGLVTIGDGSAYTMDPMNGLPWQYVARLGTAGSYGGSAVYLGNGYLLTANHVTPYGPVFLNGMQYPIDTSFGSNGSQQVAGVDLMVVKITGDPGLPPLELTTPDDVDLGHASALVGWGLGKGTPVPNQGWYWGDNSTSVERWGTNDTDAALYVPQPNENFPGEHLTTHFDFNLAAGPSEAQLTLYDSGSGLFQMQDGVWKLAGIGTDADHADKVFAALYDQDGATPGNQPDASYYLRVETYRDEIFAIAPVPEPSLGLSLLLGGGILAGWPVRRRGWRGRSAPH